MERMIVDPNTGLYVRFFSSIDEFNVVLDEFNRCVRNKIFEKTKGKKKSYNGFGLTEMSS